MLVAGCPEARCSVGRRGAARPFAASAAWQSGARSDRVATGGAGRARRFARPFMGSGTTAVAAEKHGREWLGIEVNPDFARAAGQRIRQARTANDRPSKEVVA